MIIRKSTFIKKIHIQLFNTIIF